MGAGLVLEAPASLGQRPSALHSPAIARLILSGSVLVPHMHISSLANGALTLPHRVTERTGYSDTEDILTKPGKQEQ